MKRWLLVLLLVLACTNALAATVRGRVDIALQYGVVPMAGANVGLCAAGGACINYVTGADGMYYFNVGPGNYSITINGTQRMQTAVSNQPSVDMAPIRAN